MPGASKRLELIRLREQVAARTRLIEQQRQRAQLSRRARSLRTSLNRSNRRLQSP